MDESSETIVMQGEVVNPEPPKKKNTVLWIVIIVIKFIEQFIKFIIVRDQDLFARCVYEITNKRR